MKTIINEDKIIVFLNKAIEQIDLENEEELEDYFRTLFLNLNSKYNIKLNGFYNVDVYKDNNYGIILEITNEELDYYNYFNQVDMKINISTLDTFLYEIDYIFINEIKSKSIYQYKNKLYLKTNDKDNISKVLEFVNIIYGQKVEDILKYGKKVNI